MAYTTSAIASASRQPLVELRKGPVLHSHRPRDPDTIPELAVYLLYSLTEMTLTLLVVWYAWKWPRRAES